jgi:Trk-type K+ transport system membrane component
LEYTSVKMEKKNYLEGKKGVSSYINYSNALLAISFIFLIIGVLFYLSWSILYNTWSDPGLYSFCLPMAIFGILGIAFVKSGSFN